MPTPETARRLARTMLLAAAAWCSVMPLVNAQQVDLGAAAEYSGFFFGNLSKIPDIEGRLAVGGNLSIGGTSIGGRVPAGSTQPSLVVGGNITTFTGGAIYTGNQAGYGVYAGTKAAAVPSYLDLRKVTTPPVDFEAEFTYLTILSQQLRDTPPTGTAVLQWSTVTLTGSNQDIEVFNLTAAQVKSTYDFQLQNIKPSAYVILNVASDAQRQIKMGISMAAFTNRNGRVLFNMPDTDVLNLVGILVQGSILAPYACVKNSNGHLEGTIVAASWDSTMEIGYGPFEPSP